LSLKGIYMLISKAKLLFFSFQCAKTSYELNKLMTRNTCRRKNPRFNSGRREINLLVYLKKFT